MRKLNHTYVVSINKIFKLIIRKFLLIIYYIKKISYSVLYIFYKKIRKNYNDLQNSCNIVSPTFETL